MAALVMKFEARPWRLHFVIANQQVQGVLQVFAGHGGVTQRAMGVDVQPLPRKCPDRRILAVLHGQFGDTVNPLLIDQVVTGEL